jgi:lipid-binding SYLF domain-containing protein
MSKNEESCMTISGFFAALRDPRFTACFAALALASTLAGPVRAEESFRLQELVERARFTLELFDADKDLEQFRAYVPYAHALMIVPEYIKGAFGIGAAGGRGVLVTRDDATGKWSSPAFYRLWSASLGLQIGGSNSEMILIFQSREGADVLGKSTVKFGVDAAVAAGASGYSAEGGTAAQGTWDIAAFSRAKGAFMGASLSGTTMSVKEDWNATYYGRPVSVEEILSGAVRNPKADGLSRAAEAFFNANSGRAN